MTRRFMSSVVCGREENFWVVFFTSEHIKHWRRRKKKTWQISFKNVLGTSAPFVLAAILCTHSSHVCVYFCSYSLPPTPRPVLRKAVKAVVFSRASRKAFFLFWWVQVTPAFHPCHCTHYSALVTVTHLQQLGTTTASVCTLTSWRPNILSGKIFLLVERDLWWSFCSF